MLGGSGYAGTTIHVPPWTSSADVPPSFCLSPSAAVDDYSIFFQTASLQALQPYLPSGARGEAPDSDHLPVDAHSCDHFRMFDFKVRKCTRGRSHDWTECPFAHPGEKARRRDPRTHSYSAAACPEFWRGGCRKADTCELAHGVFESWLHPARYHTQPCKDRLGCRRRVCFFAHTPDQLRVVSPGPDRLAFASLPPDSASPLAESPPRTSMVASLWHLHLSKVHSASWPMGSCSSPRVKMSPKEYFSLPTTPTRPAVGCFDTWEEEDASTELVESGRDLRAKMFEKLSKENPLDGCLK